MNWRWTEGTDVWEWSGTGLPRRRGTRTSRWDSRSHDSVR